VGVLDIAALKPGETVFVSGAAGAVGSMAWLREGKIAHAETIVDGLDRAPGAFIDLLRGANTGKMLVRL